MISSFRERLHRMWRIRDTAHKWYSTDQTALKSESSMLRRGRLHRRRTQGRVAYKLCVIVFIRGCSGLHIAVEHPGYPNREALNPAIVIHINFDLGIDRWQASPTETHMENTKLGASACRSWIGCGTVCQLKSDF